MTGQVDLASLEQRDRDLTTQAVRLTVVAGSAALMAVAFPAARTAAAVGAACLLGLAIDVRNPLSLRNLFLVYSAGLFVVGGHLLTPDRPVPVTDLLLYVSAFLLGYGLAVLPPRWAGARLEGAAPPVEPRLEERDLIERAQIERLLWLLVLLQGARLALLMLSYGVGSFYSGQELGDRISAYGQAGTTTQTSVNLLLTALVAATTAVYARHCLRTGLRPNYRLLFAVLLAGPAISFQRAMLVYHGLLFVATYVCVGPFTEAVRPAARPDSMRAGRPGGPGQSLRQGHAGQSLRSGRRSWLVIVLVLAGAALAAIRIGDIRAKELQRQSAGVSSHEGTLVQVLRGEFTPIVFYEDVKDGIGFLGYRKGVNIVAALGTRFVPRSVWGSKPITSQEYYMRQLRPAELDAGFSLAPSLFGVGYLNFGLLGCALLVSALGAACAWFDRAYVAGVRDRVPQFLIAMTWFYSLLRDDLSTSLASVFITFAVYGLLLVHFDRKGA